MQYTVLYYYNILLYNNIRYQILYNIFLYNLRYDIRYTSIRYWCEKTVPFKYTITTIYRIQGPFGRPSTRVFSTTRTICSAPLNGGFGRGDGFGRRTKISVYIALQSHYGTRQCGGGLGMFVVPAVRTWEILYRLVTEFHVGGWRGR